MSDAPPTSPEPVKTAHPLVLALLAAGVFAGIAAGIVFSRSSTVHGGPLALDAVQDGEIDAAGATHGTVPGRESAGDDVADVWTVALEASKTYTIQVCSRGSASGRNAYNPALVIHGPGGGSDHRVQADGATPDTGVSGHKVVVYTTETAGTHSIWVYKPSNHNGGRYRIQVTRGAHPQMDASLCM